MLLEKRSILPGCLPERAISENQRALRLKSRKEVKNYRRLRCDDIAGGQCVGLSW
jgi:hypothetical protein